MEPCPSLADSLFVLRRLSVIAAALFLLVCVSGCGAARESREHSCVATDQRFIATASVDVMALGSMTADYQSGMIDPDEVAEQAFDAAKRVTHVEPHDFSLRTAQKYLDGMFREYGEAVVMQSKGKDASDRMYRAYGLANFARDVLAQAQPALLERGCDVGPLL
jgi:hypothetical protein